MNDPGGRALPNIVVIAPGIGLTAHVGKNIDSRKQYGIIVWCVASTKEMDFTHNER